MSNTITENFSIFLLDAFQKLSGKTNNTIVTYSFETQNVQFQKKLNSLSKNFEKFFYWEKPKEQFFFLGLGELFSVIENGKNRFTSTEKKVRNWTNNQLSNWNNPDIEVPLFVGGMKFLPENGTSLWDNYADSTWIVPRILLLQKEGREYVIYNFLLSGDSQQEKIIEDFNVRISAIMEESVNNSSQPEFKVLSSTGDGPKEKKRWMEYVKKAIEKIEDGLLNKVVLSRMVEYKLLSDPDIFHFIDKFRQNYSECYLFIFHSGKSSFFGASPETLVELQTNYIESDSLAGSAPRGKDDIEDKKLEEELLSSKKDLLEHNAVIQHIEKQLEKLNIQVIYQSTPVIKKLHNIQHLWTKIHADVDTAGKVFSILEALHPTPAVCGVPTANAMQVIKETEDYARGLYSGIIGWFNPAGQGEFTVAIRSALLKTKKLYTFAGSGIVEGSIPQNEYKETELKLKPMHSLLENEDKS